MASRSEVGIPIVNSRSSSPVPLFSCSHGIYEPMASPLITRCGVALILVLLLAGCGGLQEVWEGPGAKVFHPRVIAVLPPMASQYDSAREEIQ